MTDKKLRDLWDTVASKQPYMPDFLTEVYLKGISDHHPGMRGARDLRIKFNYPVSVIAGKNGSGKSTVLLAAACAYEVLGTLSGDFAPHTLFPNYRPGQGTRGDQDVRTILQYEYLTPNGQCTMQWRRTDRWKWFFLDSKINYQPKRKVHLITPGNFTNPSERRNVSGGKLRMKSVPQELPLTVSQIEFTEGLLPFNYSEVIDLFEHKKSRLLVATQTNGVAYSELHMAAGERTILRLSQDIADAQGALVLIDEVEAGLHPFVQKVLMQKLQQLALRKNLQIIVTTHSPVVLDSVPKSGRIFLERDRKGEAQVVLGPYRGLMQDMLYERLDKKFNLLCEDNSARGVLDGVFDTMIPDMFAERGSIHIASGMGAKQFPTAALVLNQVDSRQNFIFVLDGDQEGTPDGDQEGTNVEDKIISVLSGNKKSRSKEEKEQDRNKYQWRIIFLPGNGGPEEWVWSQIQSRPDDFADKLGMNSTDLVEQTKHLDADYDSVSCNASETAKKKLCALSKTINRDLPNICRTVSREEARRKDSDIQPLVKKLKYAFQTWDEGT